MAVTIHVIKKAGRLNANPGAAKPAAAHFSVAVAKSLHNQIGKSIWKICNNFTK